MTVTTTSLPMILTEVHVASATRLSPSFVRLELASPDFAELGVDGPWLDQRFKLVVPHQAGGLTSVEGADESWLSTWLDRPVEERGHMRTYSVRDVVGEGADTRLLVDVVVHPHGPAGPGADWAMLAAPGNRAVVLAPRRGHPFGGIEFAPPAGARLLLVGDETAAPARASWTGQRRRKAIGTVNPAASSANGAIRRMTAVGALRYRSGLDYAFRISQIASTRSGASENKDLNFSYASSLLSW
jgi:NADPH-dependent ferric siderophore reductase